MRVHILGAGRVGTALSSWLRAADVSVDLQHAPREPLTAPLDADLVILSVPDDVIAAVALRLSGNVPRAYLVHTAGAFGPDLLAPSRLPAHRLGVWHPLGSVQQDSPPPQQWTATGALELERQLAELTRSFGALCYGISSDQRAVYHAGAVMASNYVTTLLASASQALTLAGLPPADADRAAISLATSALAAAQARGIPDSLTGPVARGDVGTVAAHLAALPRDLATLYEALARQTVHQFRAQDPTLVDRAKSLREHPSPEEIRATIVDGPPAATNSEG